MRQQQSPRVRTFESDGDEMVILSAGRSETEHRTIFAGKLDGRYAIVPVDELAERDDGGVIDAGEPLLDEMRLVGQTVVVPEDGHTMVSLETATKHIKRMDRKGAYGLLWVPFE